MAMEIRSLFTSGGCFPSSSRIICFSSSAIAFAIPAAYALLLLLFDSSSSNSYLQLPHLHHTFSESPLPPSCLNPSSSLPASSSPLLHSLPDHELFRRSLEADARLVLAIGATSTKKEASAAPAPFASSAASAGCLRRRRFDPAAAALRDKSKKKKKKKKKGEAEAALHDKSEKKKEGEAAALHDKSKMKKEAAALRDKSKMKKEAAEAALHDKSKKKKDGEAAAAAAAAPWKVAFLFLTRGPLPFAPLWERFFHGHQDLFNIYVHLDPFLAEAFESELSAESVFCGRLVSSFPTERGAPSLSSAERRLLANALLHDPLNLYFALLSDHCIPLTSFHGVYDFLLRQSHGKSFIEILRSQPALRRRYESRGGDNAMLPEVPLERFRVGSQFFVLNRDHAVSIVADDKIWSKFNGPCSDMTECYTEEHYFPTFVDMAVRDAGECVETRTLTHVQWFYPNDGHPRTFRAEEVNAELIVDLRRNGSFLFARKFSDDSLLPLLQLSSFIFQDS